MALHINEAQLSLFPTDPAVVMAAQPAQAVSTVPPIFGFQEEENGTVAPENALENGILYLREQGGPGHRFTQAEVSKAVFAFRRWMEAMPEDEDGGRYARIFITEFMDSGYCLHPDDYLAYVTPTSPAQAEDLDEDDDVLQSMPDDDADSAAQAEEVSADTEAHAEEEADTSQDSAVPPDLSILKSMLSVRVFNAVTTTHYVGRYPSKANDPACHVVVERYTALTLTVQEVDALEAMTEEFLKQVPEVFCEVRKELKERARLDRKLDEQDSLEEEKCPDGDDDIAPEGESLS